MRPCGGGMPTDRNAEQPATGVVKVRHVLERWHGVLRFTRRAWGLAAPYWRSNERWRARLLLVVIIALTLGLILLSVLYNDWNRAFFEAIQNKDFASFGPLLLRFACWPACTSLVLSTDGI
jgi:ABC-type uncharacterized transport system fused permease/ATPase subunit